MLFTREATIMLRLQPFKVRQTARAAARILLATVLAAVLACTAFGMIEGGTGNAPVNDPGWPEGALRPFNNVNRIACWAGPMGADSMHHAECRGDAKAFSAFLADFAKLKVKHKPIVVHDGIGNSVWLNISKRQ
jgi:hypothetical protein